MTQPIRLYTKAVVSGFKRSQRNQDPNSSLLRLEGVSTRADATHYLGKRVAYVYRAKRIIDGSNIRVIWGRITRPHGNVGGVRAQFKSNLPAKAFGASVRVMLYPSRI
ncbi:60S ribosomal protein l35a [Capsaspora owczarzaki ATCC 30864]|uniref:60S ribosomal protein l35a n=1 Tax=Capsaspora owczarzaki (strain ATCC 30864) TaxID=595528 RepID=A0A0D2VFC9_CAPO3|nr:60S ribosomal protein l35a [Capsaspora owczarzaki ATCC 30864]KJE88432.1 60S ribosomal protein l35a [Capsaspora owczarzaki ATCC 30864]|eukprot:XP_004364961.1 60S ribosomal protein l35a [Capsaspora owczarzaki ATCC 30864]